ncbi:MAG TPA: hypothetical protein VF761_05665 [Gemmatimonadaceae bacterium]
MRKPLLTAALLATAAWTIPVRAQQIDLSDKIRLNGYSNFEFEYMPSKAGRGDGNASFDAQEFDLVFNIIPTDRLRVNADMRWEHGVATEDSRGNAAISHAFAEYTVRDALRLRAGKILLPFGIYNEIHTAKPAIFLYKEPFAVYKTEKLGGVRRFQPRSGAGLEALGSGGLGGVDADYTVLVVNGETTGKKDPFEEDDNRAKSLTARFRVHPASWVMLGTSYYHDQLTEFDATGKDTGRRTRQSSYVQSLELSPGPVLVQGEWARGNVTPSSAPGTDMEGWYAVASVMLLDRYRPYVELQHFDPSRKLANDEVRIVSPGVNLRMDGGLYLKFQVDKYHSLPANTRFKGVDYTELTAAVAVAF